MVNGGEIPFEVFAHPVKCNLVHEAVVRNKADDPIAAFQSVDRPSKELNVRVRKSSLIARGRGLGVGRRNTTVDDGVFAVLIVVVLVRLVGIVWRVANDDRDRRFALPLYALGIFRGDKAKLPLRVLR